MHYRVILAIARFLESAVAQQEMNDRQQYHGPMTDGRADLQGGKHLLTYCFSPIRANMA